MVEITRDAVVETARKTLGTRWVHQGRTLHGGMDCAGMVLWTLRDLRVTDYEPPPYDKSAKWHEFLTPFESNLEPIAKMAVKPGDVVCIRQTVYPCHCGIIGGYPDGSLSLIHAYALRHKVVEERYTEEWRKLTRAAFRIPGVEG